MASQHTFAIVFVIKLHHQANNEKDRENKRSKKKPSKEKQNQRRNVQRTEAEGKKVALASQHTYAIIFIIKLQHQVSCVFFLVNIITLSLYKACVNNSRMHATLI